MKLRYKSGNPMFMPGLKKREKTMVVKQNAWKDRFSP